MNTKTIALLVVALVLAVCAFFVGKHLLQSDKSPKQKPIDTVSTEGLPKTNQPPSTAEQSYLEFLKWKKEGTASAKEIDDRLTQLATQFPTDYRYSLEKVRGSSNIKGVHSHAEEFEILEEAARKAIACQCGDAEKMRTDLLVNKNNKQEGFWKLSTHPHQWGPILEGLEKQDAELLEKTGAHH